MSVPLNVLCDVGIVGRSPANASCGAACGAGDIDSTSGDSVTASREKFGTSTSANTLPRKFRRGFVARLRGWTRSRLPHEMRGGALTEDVLASPVRAQRLHREAQRMAAVVDPRLATIYEVDVWRRRPMLVCELMERGTLADRLGDGPMPEAEALGLGAALAEALGALHGKHLLHGDIKPSNVGFTADGHPKLLDFGLTQLLSDDDEPLRPIAGTRRYMSPETLSGAPSAASSMCAMRARSSACKLHLGLRDDGVTEMPRQIVRGPKVDLPASEQSRQFLLHRGQREEPRRLARLEFDQQIHVARRLVSTMKHRPKKRQPRHVVTGAKRRKGCGGDLKAADHEPILGPKGYSRPPEWAIPAPAS